MPPVLFDIVESVSDTLARKGLSAGFSVVAHERTYQVIWNGWRREHAEANHALVDALAKQSIVGEVILGWGVRVSRTTEQASLQEAA